MFDFGIIFMNKKRFISIGILVFFCMIGILMLILKQQNSTGDVVIYVDGNEYDRMPLSFNKELDVRTDYGMNHVVIRDGACYVSDADCANHICVKTGAISKGGSVISCLPHKLIIAIEKEGQVDSVAY